MLLQRFFLLGPPLKFESCEFALFMSLHDPTAIAAQFISQGLPHACYFYYKSSSLSIFLEGFPILFQLVPQTFEENWSCSLGLITFKTC
jgi:hypothetical protein